MTCHRKSCQGQAKIYKDYGHIILYAIAAQDTKQNAACNGAAEEEEPELFKADDFRIYCMKVCTAAVHCAMGPHTFLA